MPIYKVSKNLEREPIVFGVKTKFFFRLLGLLPVGILGILVIGMMMLNNFSKGLTYLLVFLLVFLTVFISLWRYYIKLSNQDKYKFEQKPFTISNKDLFNQI